MALSDSPLHRLAAQGQSVWLDKLSRDLVHGGELARELEDNAVTGVTSNPTIFQKAISAGTDYDDQMAEVFKEERDPRRVFFRLAVDDVRDACDLLRPVWDATNGTDGYVSLEVDPGLAHDADATFAQAIELHGAIDRPNAYIKIPATVEGLAAIEASIAHSVPINVTLIFGLERYRAVVEAYLRGLEQLVAGGGDPSKVHSVASFFVSRLDGAVDPELEKAGRKDLAGKLGIANARLAHKHFQEAFSGERWQALERLGADPQKPLWASTSTKNPAYRDTLYVEELIGPQTVNTIPPETLDAFQDHGEVRGDTILEGVDEAATLLDEVAAAGIDYDAVVATLEREGVASFAKSFDELIDGLVAKRGALAGATTE